MTYKEVVEEIANKLADMCDFACTEATQDNHHCLTKRCKTKAMECRMIKEYVDSVLAVKINNIPLSEIIQKYIDGKLVEITPDEANHITRLSCKDCPICWGLRIKVRKLSEENNG